MSAGETNTGRQQYRLKFQRQIADDQSVIPSLLRKWPSGPGWKCGPKGHNLETAHLVLRPPKPKDDEAIQAVFDEEAVHWLGLPSEKAQLGVFAREAGKSLQRRPYIERWVICDRSSKQVIGIRTLRADPTDPTICSTESALASNWRGRGLAKEDLAAMIGLMPHLGFKTVQALAFAEHEKAITLYTKFGFTRVQNLNRTMPNGYVAKSWLMTFEVSASKKHCELR